MKANKISVAIPCYNEESVLPEFYTRITKMASSLSAKEFEFIFVNDGSSDKTQIILDELSRKDNRVKVLHLAQNSGHQNALTAGMDFATGDIVVTIDADLQDPPELIPEMIKQVENGYDIVHTKRKHREGESWFKLTTAALFYYFMRRFLGVDIIENCGDFRAFNAKVHQTVFQFRAPHRFLRGLFVKLGFKQYILEFNRSERFAGETKYPLFKMINLAVDASLGFSAAPIQFIIWLSILLWGISFTYLIWALVMHMFFNLTVQGWMSIIVLMFFFTGLILFCLAIIGFYVGRIFQQGQNRPLYWLNEVRNIDLDMLSGRKEEVREIKLMAQIKNMPKS